jgi:hypothetical protein
MPHVREQIRNTVATLLSGIAGGRVYTSRVYPLEVLPAVGIFANSEISTQDPNLAAARLNREVDLVIEIAAEAISDVDATVDVIASSVESALAANPTLSGIAVDVTLTGTTIEIEDSGDIPLAFARLTYRAWYRTTAANPDAAI